LQLAVSLRSAVIRHLLPALTLTLSAHADPIDLPAVLRLAGAQNLDVQFAAEKVKEARAIEQGTLWSFFPWIAPGAGYRAHDGRIQNVEGDVFDVNKQSLAVGPAIAMQLDLGDAIYKRLAAKQLSRAAEHGAAAQKLQSMLAAAEGYFDLVKAQATAGVAREAVRISADYRGQISNAVKAGVAFKGDALRADTQFHRDELLEIQAGEQRRVAAARLAQVLHLDPAVNLVPREDDAVPLKLISPGKQVAQLIGQALAARPEIKQGSALKDAAREGLRGAKYGPLIPTLGAQGFAGGLGGQGTATGNFGGSEDYQLTLGWRIGAGGLFDNSRIHLAESKLAQSEITVARARDAVAREVVENFERMKSLRAEVEIAKQGVNAAREGLKLAQERKEFAVGIVLETLQSAEDATDAKLDYVNTVLELNKVQYRLKAALGE
jgi:outer membrane protein TolC